MDLSPCSLQILLRTRTFQVTTFVVGIPTLRQISLYINVLQCNLFQTLFVFVMKMLLADFCFCDIHVLLELVLLDKRSAGDVRTTLKMMLTDSERRQALVQELVTSNNQLKCVWS